jgi:long-chain acyl-CoA synthetase
MRYNMLSIERWALDRPTSIAVVDGEQQYTYLRLLHSISGGKSIISKLSGDYVGLKCSSSFLFISMYYSILSAGKIPVPVDADNSTMMASVSSLCCGVIIDPKEYASTILPYLPTRIVAESMAYDRVETVLFTSGTTGSPKPVHIRYDTTDFTASNIVDIMGMTLTSGWREVVALPLCHSFGLGRMRSIFKVGGTLILCPRVLTAMDMIIQHRATGFAMVPAGIDLLIRRNRDKFQHLRSFLYAMEIGSAPMSMDKKMELADLLPSVRLIQHYGSTEASRSTFLDFRADMEHLDSVGRVASGVGIHIEPCPGIDSDAGEIVVAGGNVANLERICHMGDIGRIQDGYLYLLGRIDDLLTVGGHSFMAQQVEAGLSDLLGETAVVTADMGGLATLVAFCVRNPKYTQNEVRKYMSDKGYPTQMIPRIVKSVDALPKTHNGKIKRNELLDMLG